MKYTIHNENYEAAQSEALGHAKNAPTPWDTFERLGIDNIELAKVLVNLAESVGIDSNNLLNTQVVQFGDLVFLFGYFLSQNLEESEDNVQR